MPSDHASFKSTLHSKTGYGGLDEAFACFLMGTGIPSCVLDDPDMGVADTLLNGVTGHFQECHLRSSETIRAELFVLAITGKTGIDGSVFRVRHLFVQVYCCSNKLKQVVFDALPGQDHHLFPDVANWHTCYSTVHFPYPYLKQLILNSPGLDAGSEEAKDELDRFFSVALVYAAQNDTGGVI